MLLNNLFINQTKKRGVRGAATPTILAGSFLGGRRAAEIMPNHSKMLQIIRSRLGAVGPQIIANQRKLGKMLEFERWFLTTTSTVFL